MLSFKPYPQKVYTIQIAPRQEIKLILKQISSTTPRCKFVNCDDNSTVTAPSCIPIDNCVVKIEQEDPVIHIPEPTSNETAPEMLYPIITKVETISESEHDKNAYGMMSLTQCRECGIIPEVIM